MNLSLLLLQFPFTVNVFPCPAPLIRRVPHNSYASCPVCTQLEASKAGDEGTVRELLARGENANQVDSQGRTPLVLAAIKGHTGVVRLLLWARSASVGTVWAVKGGQLVSAVNQGDKCGSTALHYAAWHDRADTALALLAGGANPDAKTNRGEFALMVMWAKTQRKPQRLSLVR